MDVRDGNEGENGSPIFKGVPYYIKKINEYVSTFAMAINEGYIDKNSNGIIGTDEDDAGHADGFGIDPDGVDGSLTAPTNIRFFTFNDSNGNPISSSDFIGLATGIEDDPLTLDINESIPDKYKNITAKNFSISNEILTDYNAVAISSDENQVGNIDILNKILELRHSDTMFSEGAPEDFMKSIVTTLGIDAQQAERINQIQIAIVKQVENNKLSYSGVSQDEEIANMVKYQQSYSAAAKMISTMAEIYDILININNLILFLHFE